MIMLRICYALLSNHEQLASEIGRAQQAFKQRISNPSRTIVTPEVLHIFLCDFHNWRQIGNWCASFAASIELLLDVMQLRDDVTDQRDYQTLIIELRGRCTNLGRTYNLITTLMDDTLKYIEIGRSYRESLHVKMLSMLAIVYLPLSLASSLLSMQTRFFELWPLALDFVVTAMLFITITVLIYKLLTAARSSIHKLRLRVASRKSVVPLVALAYAYTCGWLFLLGYGVTAMYAVRDVSLPSAE